MDADPAPEPEACYGLLCPKRSTCQLHANLGLVEGMHIESCQQGWTWPLFRHIEGETMD